MNKRSILIITSILSLTASLNVQAIQGALTANVLRTVVATDLFGGCMAALSKQINTATNAPNCQGPWVTFSCSGDFAAKDIAFRMLDQAQLAKATNRSVVVVVDDSKKHNGFCFARRIFVE